jgi:hypothetical protein
MLAHLKNDAEARPLKVDPLKCKILGGFAAAARGTTEQASAAFE